MSLARGMVAEPPKRGGHFSWTGLMDLAHHGPAMNLDLQTLPYYDELTPQQVERIKTLVAQGLSLDERWLSYGQAYGDGAAGGGNPLEEIIQNVKHRIGALQAILCSDSQILKVAASPATGTALSLAFVVTGKLVSAKFNDIDVVQLGVLLAQAGLFTICSNKL